MPVNSCAIFFHPHPSLRRGGVSHARGVLKGLQHGPNRLFHHQQAPRMVTATATYIPNTRSFFDPVHTKWKLWPSDRGNQGLSCRVVNLLFSCLKYHPPQVTTRPSRSISKSPCLYLFAVSFVLSIHPRNQNTLGVSSA